jgi:hypothetical protein
MAATEVRVVRVEDPNVSGTHLKVEPVSNGVLVTDLGSTNGSGMWTSGDGEPFQLRAHVAQTAAVGSVVHVGPKERFWVRAADGPPS